MLQKIYKVLLDFIFPIECLSCGKSHTLLCSDCLLDTPFRLHQSFLESGMQISVVYGYSIPLIRKVIIRAKYYYSSQLFIDLTLHGLPAFLPFLHSVSAASKIVLLPVPLHFLRKKKRGYNQSFIIADSIADHFPNFYCIEFVERQKNTLQQAKLKKQNRQTNLLGAFSVNMNTVHSHNISKDTPIVIVDDVISTGSTVMEVEKTLKEAGFTHVSALGLSRGG